ncbi:hypothetical protein HN385_02790 [archaeon]|jgi:N-acetylglucosamine malate deacetylase 1|nr:hypothetical protein [archaeon]MBT3450678.1 hypothetical protein [archaeon]MBT6868742.1 hypothetical protein [archaeon]MBT7193037.1 hypothetical protein [archaeon]MBT7381003.1 hypothetical protein [archaeon]
MGKNEGKNNTKVKSKADSKKVKNTKKKETILVLGAHSDDFVIGAGGTIAKYVNEGKKVISFSFSYGEMSHPWLKEEAVQDMRTEEAFEASKVLKCRNIFFSLKEGKFLDEYKEKNITEKIIKIIEKEQPTKIFTHSIEDPHPDHKAVNQMTMEIYDELPKKLKPEIYVYSVWNPVSFKTKWPSLYINVTKTFGLKLEALKTFKSQKIHVAYPFFLLLFRGIKEGFKIRTLFGEMFYRIK